MDDCHFTKVKFPFSIIFNVNMSWHCTLPGYGFLVFERMADAQMALAKEIYIDGHLAKMHPYTPPGRLKVAA